MITIAPNDSCWPLSFAAEAERLRTALGADVERIEHVGSTSVPGLAAKPVIDIQVSVPSLKRRQFCGQQLGLLGYTHFALGDFDLVYPFFKRPVSWPSAHHVHLCETGSAQERDHLAFRDYLRGNPNVAMAYVELKVKLAAEHHGLTLESQESYSLAKNEFVRRVLQAAALQKIY